MQLVLWVRRKNVKGEQDEWGSKEHNCITIVAALVVQDETFQGKTLSPMSSFRQYFYICEISDIVQL